MAELLSGAAAQAGVKPLITEETALEVVRQVKDGKEYGFVLNLTSKAQPLPGCFAGETDLLTGRDSTTEMDPFDRRAFCK